MKGTVTKMNDNMNNNFQYNYNYNEPPQKPQSTGLAIASMVLGIVSIVFSCVYYISLICAVVGLVLGIVSLKKYNAGRKMAIAGIVTSSVSFFLIIIWVLIIGIVAMSYSSAIYESFSESFTFFTRLFF